MANFKEGLLITIQQMKYKFFMPRELAKKLNLHSVFEKQQMEKALEELVFDGELTKVEGGKFKVMNKQTLIKGVLKGNRRGFAFLIREDKGNDLFIPNKSLKGAFHKDTVYAQIVSGDEGEVVSIIERNKDDIVGTMNRNGKNGFIVPDEDSYYTDLFVQNTDVENNTKVIAKIISYQDSRNPNAKVLEVLGQCGDIQTEVMAILKSYKFSDTFPNEVVSESEKLVETVSMIGRTDFSDILTVTIDGDDAKDFDDAISLVKINGGYRLYVHIADVAEYVKLNSAIDIEARTRGTSVYFPGSVYPMLPERLCNNLCSLRPNEKKPVLTCIMDIDYNGAVIASKLQEGIIESTERLTYTNVMGIINGDVDLIKRYEKVYPTLLDMRELAKMLSEKRKKRGAINFISKEMKVILNEKGEIVALEKYPYEESNSIIEEFMLAANETVAEYICGLEYPFIYRVHDLPLEEKMQTLKDFLSGCGITIKELALTPLQFSAILDDIKGTPTEGLINKVMLRSMSKARYDSEHDGHFGLAAEFYCHFTSPIRRYPDLTIHRIIKDVINGKMTDKKLEMYKKLTEDVATSSTERERASEQAERDIDDYYKAMYMTEHVGERFDGIISGVTSFGVFVELDNTIEGLISLDNLQGYGYILDQAKYTLSNGIITYKLGDKLTIEVESADTASRRVRFVPYDENAPKTNAIGGDNKSKIGMKKPMSYGNSAPKINYGDNSGKTSQNGAKQGGTKAPFSHSDVPHKAKPTGDKPSFGGAKQGGGSAKNSGGFGAKKPNSFPKKNFGQGRVNQNRGGKK